MRKIPVLAMSIMALALPLAACSDPKDTATAEQSYGSAPTLPAPEKSWLPTINIATATGWPDGGKPKAASGMAVNAFATGLDHPRTVHVLPNGDVLVAESMSEPDKPGSLFDHAMTATMKRARAFPWCSTSESSESSHSRVSVGSMSGS